MNSSIRSDSNAFKGDDSLVTVEWPATKPCYMLVICQRRGRPNKWLLLIVCDRLPATSPLSEFDKIDAHICRVGH